ncbi:immunoglobulin-binding protein 1-like [Pollicipes pollicipes]|uniref:immunoglobulin-binding protein 1-like n=1 Tax=Pollicipes pollicipes TaxID=41117 RepID=UPI0018853663|nr:immunoglobulin-binding protein 1-like [Pollicipes pollicipes]
MSVEEFYEQRVREGVFPDPGKAPARGAAGGAAGGQQQDPEANAEHEERLQERDDPAALARARQWDDYKDDHKRGEGNRYNRS